MRKIAIAAAAAATCLAFNIAHAAPPLPEAQNTMNIYTVQVMEIRAYFSWLGPSEWNTTNVSASSKVMYPGELDELSVTYVVPDDAIIKTYSYKFKAVYSVNSSAWGDMGTQYTETVLYHDLAVDTPPHVDGGEVDYMPFIIAAVVILVLGAIGAPLYMSREKPGPSSMTAESLGMPQAPASSSSELPVIHATPGERFPIERRFVYLVSGTAAVTVPLNASDPAAPPTSLSVFTSSGSGSPSPGWQTPREQVSRPSHGSASGHGVPSGAGAADSQ